MISNSGTNGDERHVDFSRLDEDDDGVDNPEGDGGELVS